MLQNFYYAILIHVLFALNKIFKEYNKKFRMPIIILLKKKYAHLTHTWQNWIRNFPPFLILFLLVQRILVGPPSLPLLLQRTLTLHFTHSTAAFASDPYPLENSPVRASSFQNFRQIDPIAEARRWRKATAGQSKPPTHPLPVITRRNFTNWSLKIKHIRSLFRSTFVSV